jgi:predicted transcriptional regulator
MARSFIEIQIHIMNVLNVDGELGIGPLIMKTNTAWKPLLGYSSKGKEIKGYLFDLEASNLVEKKEGKYRLTERGKECLDLLERGLSMIRPLREVFPLRTSIRY